MRMRRAVTQGAILLVVLNLAISTVAQTETATLSGRATDPSGAAVTGADVIVTNIETNLSVKTTTNEQGIYIVTNLRPGRYRIAVRKEGFKEIVKTGVELHVQDIIAHNFSLQVGSVIESITVLAEATRVSTSPVVSTVVDRQFVGNLPLNGRSFHALLELTPGVVLTKSTGFEQGQFSVNGQRANANYFTVDGVSANIAVASSFVFSQSFGGGLPGLTAFGGTNNLASVDAVEEFRVQTSTYAPEFGRTPGGQISIVTRSGTNEFHGSLFEYFRNDVIDANDWFANNRGLTKPALRQNDFGGVLGGPIIRDRTFFFFSYEGLRLRQPQTGITQVPSLSSRNNASSEIRPFLDAFPLPTGPDTPSGFAEFAATFSDVSTLNATSIRVDHVVNPKLSMFGRYNYVPSEILQRGGSSTSLNTVSEVELSTQTLTAGATLSISPSVVNESRFNYSRNRGSSSFRLDEFGGAILPPTAAVFPTSVSNPNLVFNILGGTNSVYQTGSVVNNLQRQVNVVNNLSWVVGSHQLRFGLDYRRLSPVFGPRDYSQQALFLGTAGASTGTALVAVILAQEASRNPIFTNWSVYAQDAWKVTPRLTITYGIRWEVNPPPSESNGNDAFTVTGLDSPSTLALAPRGTPLWDTTYSNFAPRVGVAYQLVQHQGWETILRGGFGIFYDLGNGQAAAAYGGFPFTASKFLLGVPFPLSASEAAPPPFSVDPPVGSIVVFDPSLELPYTGQWNVAVEQSLGRNHLFSASYVGALGRRLLRQERLFDPNTDFGVVLVGRNEATSDYHSLQFQYRRSLSKGLQALLSYVWSHSLDNISNDSSFGAPVQRLDPELDRGSSDFDIRHAFTGAVTYNIPAPSRNAFIHAVLNDWSIDTIIRGRSATPVDVRVTRNIGFGFGLFRPDAVSGADLYVVDQSAPGGRRFNPAAFTIPTDMRQGTLGRNALRGFDVWQVDLAVRRQFSLSERMKLQFRAEFFNVFNHPNFGDPNGFLGSVFGTTPSLNPTFGRSTLMLGRSLGTGGLEGGFSPLYQIGGPRSIQLALRLSW